MPAVCKFYQSGNCRFGNSCKFEHPGATTAANPFGNPGSNNANRFGALSNTGGGGFGSARSTTEANPYKITKDSIRIDLADERPSWILSCYGPGRDAPEQLFGGYPREQSIEEARMYVMSAANPQQALSEIQGLHQQAEQQIQTSLGNLDGAVQFLLSAENNHPNRIDICKQNSAQGGSNSNTFAVGANQPQANSAFGTQGSNVSNNNNNTGSTPNPFSANSQPSAFGGGGGMGIAGTSAFGQPSALGQKPNPFGAGSAPATTSAFGQPSALGQKPNPFGSSGATPAFGQPTALGGGATGGSAFGQPSALGGGSTGGSAFGQPSALGGGATGGSAFGQPSALGQKPNPFGAASGPSPFGQPAQPAQPASATPSAFGQPSALGQKPNPFGAPAAPAASPFGQSAAAAPNPFSKPAADQSMDTSAPAQPAAPSNPFGSGGTTGASPFGATPSSNAFAKPSPFGAAPSNNAQSAAPNPFGQPQQQQQQAPPQQAAAPGKGNPYGPNAAKQHPALEGYTTRNATNGRVETFAGKPISWKFKVGDLLEDRPPPGANITTHPPVAGVLRPDGSWMRVMFPDGPPGYNRDTEPEDTSAYTAGIKEAYTSMAATGKFMGDMPEVPPMREDCVWTF